MKKLLAFTTIGLLALTVGCSGPKIDVSTDQSSQGSIARVRAALPPERQEDFDEAVQVLAMSGFTSLASLADPEGMVEAGMERLDGLTGEEVIAEAAKVLEERRQRQLVQTRGEISEAEAELAALMEKSALADSQAEQLSAFSIDRSRFEWNESTFSVSPAIEITVTNGTDHPVARAYFHGVLATPGRAVPWVEEDFNYSISGGLEPGETATWRLAPNQFGAWGRAPKDRDDMVLTVTTYRIDGADGEPIFEARLSGSEERTIERLSDRLENLRSNLEGLVNDGQ